MTDQREILIERIALRCEELGITPRALSMRATGKPDVIRDMGRRKSLPNGATLAAIARELRTTSDWLLGLVDNPTQPVSEISFREPKMLTTQVGTTTMPVYGTGYCDDLEVTVDGHIENVEQTLFEPTNVVHLVSRPPALIGSPDAYGIYFRGSSMEPRFFQGEIGVATTTPPPGPGDFVVVQLNDGNDDTVVRVLVKQLVCITSNFVELKQFNPPISFAIDRHRITRMHKIVMSGDPASFK